ncbi:hypothetical protein IVA88_17030 [Bradyrhizobium sp. 149]|uniref:hypothetical protein n=1 Tax=Bradyrhizobium sp. 149 TaxID=2782624 RepID=UPI001FF87F1D|nr:hypothetical protein [Bradyrhizobium sp. 149]MCK1653125.1 hypothetical protein [Bradyrhizobium sp. 149]
MGLRTIEKLAAAFSLVTSAVLLILWIVDPLKETIIRKIDASSEINDSESEPADVHTLKLASAEPDPTLKIIRTNLAIEYTERIANGSAAQVTVRLSQEERLKSIAEKPKPDRVLPIDRLAWPINLALNVHGKSEAKLLAKGARLPTKLIWAPTIDPGLSEVVAILSVKHEIADSPRFDKAARQKIASIDQTGVSINEHEPELAEASDDIRLKISFTRFGMPGWLWEYVTLGGSIVSFVMGCAFLTSTFSRIWARAFSQSASPNHN